jgi:hypothetical protein
MQPACGRRRKKEEGRRGMEEGSQRSWSISESRGREEEAGRRQEEDRRKEERRRKVEEGILYGGWLGEGGSPNGSSVARQPLPSSTACAQVMINSTPET